MLSGYKVEFVPFNNGKPTGPMKHFLTGFIADLAAQKVFCRPADVAFSNHGNQLVANAVFNIIWCVKPASTTSVAKHKKMKENQG